MGQAVFGGAPVVRDDIAISKAWRIPRPTKWLVVLTAAALVAGVTVWLVGQADDSAQPSGSIRQFIDRGISGLSRGDPRPRCRADSPGSGRTEG